MASLLAVLLFSNCSDGGGSNGGDPPIDDEPILMVSPTQITLQAGGQAKLTIRATSSWSVTSTESWLSCNPSSGTGGPGTTEVTVSVASPNQTGAERRAALSFANRFKTITVDVTEEYNKPAEFYFEEPYLGWGASVSNTKAVVTANMGYEVSSESTSYFLTKKKYSEYFVSYNTNGHSLTSADVWIKLEDSSLSDLRNYLSSKLNYTYLNMTKSGSIDHYNYLSLDGKTKASIHLAYSGENYLITFEPSDNGMLFEEPYTKWDASPSTVKAALSTMGYTMTSENSDYILYDGKYQEWYTAYYFNNSKFYWASVTFYTSVVNVTTMRDHLSKVWKFTYTKESSSGDYKYYHYLSPDGRQECRVTKSDDSKYTYVWFQAAN